MQFSFGSGLLWGSRTDVANSTPVRFGAMQDVSVDFDGELKELFSQYTFPVDVARGKTKITGKAKMAQIIAVQFNNLFFGGTASTGQNLVASDEAGTIPGTPYQITVANGATFLLDLGVRDGTTGLPLTLVASAPATGQYSVATGGVYTFAAADTTKTVLFDYAYTAVTGKKVHVNNQLMGSSPRFKLVFNDTYEGNQMTLILYSAASNKLSFATKLDDYTIPELDFSAYQDAGGNVYEFSSAA